VLTRHLSKSAAGSFNLAAEHRALMPGVKTVGVTPPQCVPRNAVWSNAC
jgi:hypothetical protein